MSGMLDTAGYEHVSAPPFNVETIEEQIKEAWSELGVRAEQAGAPAPLRTSILTLVVVAQGANEIRRASATLMRLVQALPSRVIQVSIEDEHANMQARVSAHCALQPGGKPTCYELIEIDAGPAHLPAVPSILTQLDISDLTTFIWWVGPADPESDAFLRISGTAQRVIIDSARSPAPFRAFRRYATFSKNHVDSIACSDLTWTRLLVFRELVAQSFDIRAALEMLPNVHRIDMSYHPEAVADALLMAGWLTSRIGMTPFSAVTTGDGGLTLTATGDGSRTIRLVLTPVRSSTMGLRSIRLNGHSPARSSRVTIRRIDDTRAMVNVDITGLSRQQRMVHCGAGYEDQILGMELMQFNRDRIYEESLDHAAQFAGILEDEGQVH